VTRAARILVAALILVAASATAPASAIETIAREPTPIGARFRAIDVTVDADAPLAAYQIELLATGGTAEIIGVEGGEAPLDDAPRYDPAALANDRIIVAAFTTSTALAAGRRRVATIHVRETGAAPVYEIHVQAAADADGRRIEATAYASARPQQP
jgi:hypothetical protein